MILPPPHTRYSVACIHGDKYLLEFYREVGGRWLSIAHVVCEGKDCEAWLEMQFGLVLSPQSPLFYYSDAS